MRISFHQIEDSFLYLNLHCLETLSELNLVDEVGHGCIVSCLFNP